VPPRPLALQAKLDSGELTTDQLEPEQQTKLETRVTIEVRGPADPRSAGTRVSPPTLCLRLFLEGSLVRHDPRKSHMKGIGMGSVIEHMACLILLRPNPRPPGVKLVSLAQQCCFSAFPDLCVSVSDLCVSAGGDHVLGG